MEFSPQKLENLRTRLKTTYKHSKKLVFGLWPEFISRSVHAKLRVFSVAVTIRATRVNTETAWQLVIGYTISSASGAKNQELI